MNDRLAVALRVLMCVKKHQTPAWADIEHLQGWVSQDDRGADADALARIIVRGELRIKQRIIIHVNNDSATT
jgi:hypothetical protein